MSNEAKQLQEVVIHMEGDIHFKYECCVDSTIRKFILYGMYEALHNIRNNIDSQMCYDDYYIDDVITNTYWLCSNEKMICIEEIYNNIYHFDDNREEIRRIYGKLEAYDDIENYIASWLNWCIEE